MKHNIANKKNKYMLADKGYDTKDFREICTLKGYIPIIDYNKRNTKDINKLKKLTNKERQIYKKRIKVENSFCRIKQFRRLSMIYEKKLDTFISFIYLGLCTIIQKYI